MSIQCCEFPPQLCIPACFLMFYVVMSVQQCEYPINSVYEFFSCLCSMYIGNISLKLCIWIFSRENYQLWINYRSMVGHVLLSGLTLAWSMLDCIVFRCVLCWSRAGNIESWWILSLLHPQTPVEDVHVKLPVTFPGLIACMVDFDGTRLQHIKVCSIDPNYACVRELWAQWECCC